MIQDEEEGGQNESPDTTATADTEEVVEAMTQNEEEEGQSGSPDVGTPTNEEEIVEEYE